jgi:hypothetical protein
VATTLFMSEERHFGIRQIDQARTDFAIIETALEAIHARLAQMPTTQDVWRAALMGMLGGACLVQSLALLFR